MDEMQALANALSNTTVLLWMLGAAGGGWVLSGLVTHMLLPSGYPPNMARLGCWLGILAWMLFTGLVVFGYVVSTPLPTVAWVALGVVFLILTILLVAGRKRPA